MRCRTMIALLLLVLLTAPAASEPSAPGTVTVRDWLVLEPVDRRTRRPFNPDAVFERYLLERGSGRPHEGDELTGERGEKRAWKRVRAGEDSRVGGRIGWAYARLEVPSPRVALAYLDRAARLFVNGTATVGAVYGGGLAGLPVLLEKGANDIFVRGVRGSFRLTFREPPAPVFVAARGRTLPDLVVGETVDTLAGLYVVNAGREAIHGLRIEVGEHPLFEPLAVTVAEAIGPLGLRQVALPIKGRPGLEVPATPDVQRVPIIVRGADGTRHEEATLDLKVRRPEAAIVRTFRSRIDDSVQHYALRRPAAPSAGAAPRPMGLVLSLHGAGVEARAQARCHAPKVDFWHVCPTNRAPFGFDWQDWGRTDAYEALADALALARVPRDRVYLTGHSMGGHGAWHLAANDVDGFAAVAPSAGWMSFDTYAGGRPTGGLAEIWHAADDASRTRTLMSNLVQVPAFVLHGTEDDNVPVSEARTMERLLTEAGAPPDVYYAEGKGHWWNGPAARGTDCVDWPGIFELFRSTRIDRPGPALRLRTVHPSVDARHHWLTVWQARSYGRPADVETRLTGAGTLEVTTKNVRALRIAYSGPHDRIELDGIAMPSSRAATRWFVRQEGASGAWQLASGPPEGKRPHAGGPFKSAFDRRFLLVFGTKGTALENRELLERARHDGAAWAYRASGNPVVVSDRAYLEARALGRLRGRNVILYGNATTNAAWTRLLGAARLKAIRGNIQIAGESWIGEDLAALFVAPQQDDPDRLVGAFADTGAVGTRLGYALSPFVSGAGHPDYIVFGPSVATKGDDGVLAAGWFGADWQVAGEGYVRR